MFIIVGIGGAFMALSRLILRASVGLTVRAPRPEARPDAIDCRRLPEDEGVTALPCAFFEADFGAGDESSISSCPRETGRVLLILFCRD